MYSTGLYDEYDRLTIKQWQGFKAQFDWPRNNK